MNFMTTKELVEWLSLCAPPEVLHAVIRLQHTVEAASKEIVRLQEEIRKHTEKLSDPIVWNYSADDMIIENDSEKYFRTKATIRLHPIKFELIVPLAGEVKGWSEEYKRHFCDQIVVGIGHHTARLLKDKLWHKKD